MVVSVYKRWESRSPVAVVAAREESDDFTEREDADDAEPSALDAVAGANAARLEDSTEFPGERAHGAIA